MDRQIEWSIPTQRRNVWFRWLAVAAIALLAASIFVLGWHRASSPDSRLAWSEVRRGDIALASLGTGELLTTRQRLVTAGDSGVVKELAKKPGDPVERDDILLKLENAQLLLDVESSNADVERAQINASEKTVTSELDLDRAEQSRNNARLNLDVAESKLRSYQVMEEKKLISRLDFITVQAEERVANNALVSAERTLTLTRALTKQQKVDAKKSVELAKLKRRRLLERAEALSIVAGQDGVVKDIYVNLGDSLLAGAKLALVGEAAPDRARMRFPQKDLSRLKKDQAVILSLNGSVGRGRVLRIFPDLTDGYATVEVLTTQLPNDARNGMAVRGEVQLGTLTDVFYARSAFQPPYDGAPLRVHRLRNGKDDVLLIRDATSAGGNLIFPSDLKEGDLVAVDPSL